MVMRPMQKRFDAVGYRTFNFGYACLIGDIQRHGQRLRGVLGNFAANDGIDAIHLVTHSMGGIVTRCALREPSPKIGRIVMLAPPNRGSPVATGVRHYVGRLIPPIKQLSQHEGSWIAQLPAIDAEVGVIAGSHDVIVGLRNTRLIGQRDHVIVPAIHSPIVWQTDAFKHALHFIRHGRFTRQRRAVS